MTCPKCGIENPPSAQYCDCGYEFVPGSKPKEESSTQSQGTWCPKCKTFNPATNQFCGKCGAPMQKKTSPALIGCLGLVVIVVLIGVFSSGSGDKNISPSPSSPSPSSVPARIPELPKTPTECLELVKKSGSYDEYSTTITGTIKNNCGRSFSYVQVTFKLTDDSGAVVGTAMANQSSLDAGETWKFKAHGFTPSKRYRLDEITAF